MKHAREHPASSQPPRLAEAWLAFFCQPALLEEIQGDLRELFDARARRYGRLRARLHYWWDVLWFFRPYVLRRESPFEQARGPIMWKNYLKVALRTLRKHKGYALINITGLAIGMACCLLITLYVLDELSYDRHHDKADRIYRVVHDVKTPSETIAGANSQGPLAPMLAEEFPEVLHAVRLLRDEFLIQHGEQRFLEENVFYADSTVFDVFSFPLLRGDPATALAAPFTMVMTEEAAHRYFGDEDPVGRTLLVGANMTFTVTGILKEIPRTSHFTFDMLLSMTSIQQQHTFNNWFSVSFLTYALLPEDYDKAILEAKLPDFAERHMGAGMQRFNMSWTLHLEPLTDIYLRSDRRLIHPDPQGNLTNLYIFSAIALFILLIACINFMNLTTARSAERAKEVGVRKVVGAKRQGLVGQFLAESTLLSVFAMLLALLMAEAALPVFRTLSGKSLGSSLFLDGPIVGTLLGIALVLGVLAGSYPAFILSSFRPILVLKGAFRSSAQSTFVRKGLVVLQFGISVILIAGTSVAHRQVTYLQNQNLGFEKEQMLVIDFRGDETVQQQIETIKQELSTHPAVAGAAASSHVPSTGNLGAYTLLEAFDGEMKEGNLNLYDVDFDFPAHYGIEMAAGRAFSHDFPSDTTQALIVNEAAVKNLGFASAQEALGKRFSQWGREGQIIGVVKDFHYASLHERVAPLTMRLSPYPRYISLRIDTGDLRRTIEDLEQTWQQLVPHRPFDYTFLDASFDQQYHAEERFGNVAGIFAALAILIACLGLFGLAAFTAQQRTKEIGMRKVLGASVPSIFMLLSRDFIKLVALAFIVATPVAYLALNRWLDSFAYHTSLGLGTFVPVGGLVLLIALLAVSYQSIRAASANPVEALRYE